MTDRDEMIALLREIRPAVVSHATAEARRNLATGWQNDNEWRDRLARLDAFINQPSAPTPKVNTRKAWATLNAANRKRPGRTRRKEAKP